MEIQTIDSRLTALSKAQLVDMYAGLNGGSCGFDHARVSKSDLVQRMQLAFHADRIAEALDAIPAAPAALPAAPVPADAAAALAAAVQALAASVQPQAPALDVAAVERIVDSRLAAVPARRIEVIVPGREAVALDGHQHPAFETVLRLAAAGVNVMLVGPAGCGKTHLAQSIARALGKSFGSISGSAGVSEAQLTGRLLPTGDGGRFEYTPSVFVREYTAGGCFLFDEVDAFDPNCLTVVNQATANGGFDIEARAASGLDTYVRRDPGAVLLASANTYGTGAGALYVGRNQLDAATLDRWMIVEMDYDKAYERSITGDDRLLSFVWGIREAITAHRLRRVASTRMIQKGALALAAGLSWGEVKSMLLAGWTAEEQSKAGVR